MDFENGLRMDQYLLSTHFVVTRMCKRSSLSDANVVPYIDERCCTLCYVFGKIKRLFVSFSGRNFEIMSGDLGSSFACIYNANMTDWISKHDLWCCLVLHSLFCSE